VAWKVSNVYRKADPRIKSGTIPVRVYIAFEYDPRNASPFDRVIFNIVRLIYGEYPPLASLNYGGPARRCPNDPFPARTRTGTA
jgi:hypothetical protein